MRTSIEDIRQRLKDSRLLKDSFWSLLGTVIGRGFSLAAGIFIARFLGKDIFGEYGIIKTTILTIAVFSTYGLGYTATKYIAEYKQNHKEYIKPTISYALKITLLISSVMAFLLFIFADFFASNILKTPHLGNSIQIVSIIIVFNGLTTTQIGVISGFGNFKQLAQINSIVGLINFIFSFLFTYLWGFTGALFALLFTQFANFILNLIETHKEIKHINSNISTNKRKKLNNKILKFSTPVALQEMIYSIFSWLNSYILMRIASYGELGMLNAAMQWNAIILFLPNILSSVILTHLSENQQNHTAHNRLLNNTLIVNSLMILIPIIIIIIFAPFISNKLYGASFTGLASILSITAISTIFMSISGIYVKVYISKNLNWKMFYIRLFRDITILALFLSFFYFLRLEGIFSLVYSTLISYALFTFIMFLVYKKSQNKLKTTY